MQALRQYRVLRGLPAQGHPADPLLRTWAALLLFELAVALVLWSAPAGGPAEELPVPTISEFAAG